MPRTSMVLMSVFSGAPFGFPTCRDYITRPPTGYGLSSREAGGFPVAGSDDIVPYPVFCGDNSQIKDLPLATVENEGHLYLH
jgi:hypothetical protein